MKITKAVITAAGRNQRHLPLQTLVDREGYLRTALELFLEEMQSAGIKETALIICPGDQKLYKDAAGPFASDIIFIEQKQALGYGHAVLCARDFVGDDYFLLTVCDHVYVSDNSRHSCIGQLLEIAAEQECAISAVQATHESKIGYFGTIGGKRFTGRNHLYEIDKVIEKPTPTTAEQYLMVPGMRVGNYLCFFGLHVLPASVMKLLNDALNEDQFHAKGPKLQLSPVLNQLAENRQYLAAELAGRRYDLDQRYGLLMAQMALALSGKNRDDVLSGLVEILAQEKK